MQMLSWDIDTQRHLPAQTDSIWNNFYQNAMGVMKESLTKWLYSMSGKVRNAFQGHQLHVNSAANFAEALFTKGHSTADAELGISPLAVAIHAATAGVLIHQIKHSPVARWIVTDGLGYEPLTQYGFTKDLVEMDPSLKLNFLMPSETVEELVAEGQEKERAAAALIAEKEKEKVILIAKAQKATLEEELGTVVVANALQETAEIQAAEAAAKAAAERMCLQEPRTKAGLKIVLHWKAKIRIAAQIRKMQLELQKHNRVVQGYTS